MYSYDLFVAASDLSAIVPDLASSACALQTRAQFLCHPVFLLVLVSLRHRNEIMANLGSLLFDWGGLSSPLELSISNGPIERSSVSDRFAPHLSLLSSGTESAAASRRMRVSDYHCSLLSLSGQVTPQLRHCQHISESIRWELKKRPQTSVSDQPIVANHFSPNEILIVMAETAEEISKRPKFARNSNGPLEKTLRHGQGARQRQARLFIHGRIFVIGCVAVYFLVGSKLIPVTQAKCRGIVRISTRHSVIVIVLQ